jgi:hypothetical protein
MIQWLTEKLGLSHCPECSTLVDYAMDGLEEGQQAKVLKHLSGCPPCMEQVRDFLQVNEGLGLTVPESDCAEGFEKRVLERLKRENAQPLRPIPMQVALGGWPLFWLRIGPVFAAMSLVMTLVAFGAVMHSGGAAPAAPSTTLGQMTDALLKDPRALHVTLTGAAGTGGELVLCPAMKNIYLQADHLAVCQKNNSYVLWVKPQGPGTEKIKPLRVARFLTDTDGQHFQLLQLPQALDLKGPVEFTVSQDDLATPAKPGVTTLNGSVSL